jgi:MtN3 and saliva related transmembrane protein
MINPLVFAGWIAASLTIAGSFPQLIKAIRTKSTKDISMTMLAVFLIEFLLWTTYAFYIKDRPLFVGSAIPATLWIATIILKLKYDRRK